MWIVLVAMLWLPLESQSAPPTQGGALLVIAVAELPVEARDTLRTIKQGGPFAYPRDGVVFNNFERVLPEHKRGYYHEYSVDTPGANNRGVRRIVCGPLPECYYTADHYQTFKSIRE
jgi:ribonuclease T1